MLFFMIDDVHRQVRLSKYHNKLVGSSEMCKLVKKLPLLWRGEVFLEGIFGKNKHGL